MSFSRGTLKQIFLYRINSAQKLINIAIGSVICAVSLYTSAAFSDELLISWGTGSQPNSVQTNRQIAIDYNFFQINRSTRSNISVGVGFTRLTTDASTNRVIDIVSIYPQLTLIPVRASLNEYYFFVRALGPSYISADTLGDREQDNNFAFQAQFGVGYEKKLGNGNFFLMQTSWKHFSNANLFDDNDGIDVPFVLTLGYKF